MDDRQISQDDIQDVVEMTYNLERTICEVVRGNDKYLAISALINATINIMLANCNTYEQILNTRDLFINIFDRTIKDFKIKKKE